MTTTTLAPLPSVAVQTIEAVPLPPNPTEWLCVAVHPQADSEILFSVLCGDRVEDALGLIAVSVQLQDLGRLGWVVCSPWIAGEEF